MISFDEERPTVIIRIFLPYLLIFAITVGCLANVVAFSLRKTHKKKLEDMRATGYERVVSDVYRLRAAGGWILADEDALHIHAFVPDSEFKWKLPDDVE